MSSREQVRHSCSMHTYTYAYAAVPMPGSHSAQYPPSIATLTACGLWAVYKTPCF